jgi:hypothetical protein
MYFLTDFTQVKELPLYSKLYIIVNDLVFEYKKIGYFSDKQEVVMFVSCSDTRKSLGLSKYDFQNNREKFIAGDYDSEFLGNIIVSQLTELIDSVKDTYLK